MESELLRIEDLHASVEGKSILRGVNLAIPRGEVHAIMGPNGSGKSTLANVLMGHPGYQVTRGRIVFKGEEIGGLAPDERARRGVFLAFQYPVEVAGVSTMSFLRTALGAVHGQDLPVREFRKRLESELGDLGMDLQFARRNLNEGFSGGEKKRCEVLQLRMLRPELAILDETDSGLDIDGIRLVSQAVAATRRPEASFLVITHYLRILTHLRPDRVHVLVGGQVVRSGGPELAGELEVSGYQGMHAAPTEIPAIGAPR
jgi:Fe-S cluster assembly ATP-binding protein